MLVKILRTGTVSRGTGDLKDGKGGKIDNFTGVKGEILTVSKEDGEHLVKTGFADPFTAKEAKASK